MITVSAVAQQAHRTVLAALVTFVFIQGCVSLVIYQFSMKWLYRSNQIERQTHLDRSKKSFILLLVTIMTIVAPSYVRVTTDNASVAKGTFRRDRGQGRLRSRLESNSVVISNHQIYTDWVFLWWLAYTSGLAGRVYIMLKKSLAAIPVLGYGMKNYGFIFMNRRWNLDRIHLSNSLQRMDRDGRGIGPLAGHVPSRVSAEGEEEYGSEDSDASEKKWPYMLILFPEGTNMSANTRERSNTYARKINVQPFENVLLPRSTGLRFALEKLAPSCECVYDVTIGYSGVKKTTYAEQIYDLQSIFLQGQGPKLVDVHIRTFKLSEIPYQEEKAFESWLYKVWGEKDKLLERYYQKGSFDLDPELTHTVSGLCEIDTAEVFLVMIVPMLILAAASFLFTKYAIQYFGKYSMTAAIY
ncbi:AaceriACL173Cp [[Ashbya] aceris (nom. inval.)]|nr:AaceriACL173Cp [[Ashbya] aceris (nom. inval.)]